MAVYYNGTEINEINYVKVEGGGDSSGNLVLDDGISFGNSRFTELPQFIKNCNTSNVTNMGSMFNNCRNLTSLDLNNFDTSNVTDMNYMFYSCINLTSLDLSSFDTSNVTNMGTMFSTCDKLTSLDLSSFDTSKVTTMSSMFSGCSNLKQVKGKLSWKKISSVPFYFYNSTTSNLSYLTISDIGTTGTSFNFNSSSYQNWGNDDMLSGSRSTLVNTFVNYTYDRASNGMSSCTIQLYSTVKARLTETEIAQMTAKGYTVS